MSLFDRFRRRRTPEVTPPVVEPPKPKLRGEKIEKYKLSADRTQLIIDYKGGFTDVVPYSKELEAEILSRYKAQILETAKDYDALKKKRNKRLIISLIAFAAACGYGSIIVSTLAYTAAPLVATAALIGVGAYNLLESCMDSNKLGELSKPLMIAQNLDVLQNHVCGNSKAAELSRTLGREVEVPKITDYEKKSLKEVKKEIIAAGGDVSYYQNPLAKVKTKVLKR